jgi:SAM-dependent methyltransferase
VSCPICGSGDLERVFEYTEPPVGETVFELPEGQAYERAYDRCRLCGHFSEQTSIDLDATLYSGAYVDATYESAEGLRATFERIMALSPERSDNTQRSKRVNAFVSGEPRSLLDVGSGLGVFPARMKELGWDCTALDPDPRAIEFAREHIGVEGICGDFMTVEPEHRWRLVTLNKVLEHVGNPVAMLARTRDFLEDDGVVYVEVPDGEAASKDADGQGREEFFIEHLHVFSPKSLAITADRAGFELEHLESLQEPSTKYTLFAFLRPHQALETRGLSPISK